MIAAFMPRFERENKMSQVETSASYTPVAKGFHWIMALIWIAAWAIGFVAAHGDEALDPQHKLVFLHKSIASVVVALIVLRVIWRLAYRPPALPDAMSPLMRRLAHLGHLLLYAVALFGLPMSGWYWSSVVGKPVLLAGFIPLPPLVAPDPSIKVVVKLIHTYAAWFCGALVGGHVLVALKHHFVDRDDILLRMSFLHPSKA